MKDLVYLPGVVTLSLCEDACNGCGMCIKVCPHDVFELTGKKAHIVRKDYCMECGACALNCQMKAISVNYKRDTQELGTDMRMFRFKVELLLIYNLQTTGI